MVSRKSKRFFQVLIPPNCPRADSIFTLHPGFVIHGYLGARTLFTKSFGLALSVGSGLSLGSFGATILSVASLLTTCQERKGLLFTLQVVSAILSVDSIANTKIMKVCLLFLDVHRISMTTLDSETA